MLYRKIYLDTLNQVNLKLNKDGWILLRVFKSISKEICLDFVSDVAHSLLIYFRIYPPLMGGINAIVSPSFNVITAPVCTYSSFNANVKQSSSKTIFDRFGYFSAITFLRKMSMSYMLY